MKLTQSAIWTMEFNRRSQSLKECLEDLHLFIDTLLYLNQTLFEAKKTIRDWEKSAETLLMKFCFHGFSIHHLLKGVPLKSIYYEQINGRHIYDTSSCKSILRSQLEAFLMFHHIYVNPTDDHEKELRYCAWIYSSLLQRQDFPNETEYAQQQKQKDSVAMSIFQERMKTLPSFQRLSPKQQKGLLEKGTGKLFQHWSAILEATGFDASHFFSQLYAFLSMYSHSEGVSAIQMESQNEEHNKFTATLDVRHSLLLTALMIRSLVRLHPIVEIRYNALPAKLQAHIDLSCYLADEG